MNKWEHFGVHALGVNQGEQAVDPQVKPPYHDDCCCYHCAAMTSAESNPDCACDSGPFYSWDGCKACPKASFCDVPKNPQDYPHDDDCQCFKCRESNAEAVRNGK